MLRHQPFSVPKKDSLSLHQPQNHFVIELIDVRNTVPNDIHLTYQEQRKLAFPAIIALAILSVITIYHGFSSSIPSGSRFVNLLIGTIGIVYLVCSFAFVYPHLEKRSLAHWVFVMISGCMASAMFFLDDFLLPGFPLLFAIILLVNISIPASRWQIYLFAFLAYSGLLAATITSFEFEFLIQDLSFPLIAVVTAETMNGFKHNLALQLHRREIINKVSHSLSSSLEEHQVLALVGTAIQSAMDADTYYVGTLKNNRIHLELLFDDGQFFPSQEYSLDDTLSGWVITHHQSLLIDDISKGDENARFRRSVVGQPRDSRSWIGTPLESGTRMIGVVAVAAYKPNAFSKGDLEVLENIAKQASLALDNASQHAQVEYQTRLDSLTGAYNHGYFLRSLSQAFDDAHLFNYPISLIMLDIDHFKDYNDKYGHLVGDQVLRSLAETVQHTIKNTDLFGRWGGEEFTIALPRATGAQAVQVAERIRQALHDLVLTDRNNMPILAPTISQGIAVFPFEVTETFGLIDLADQRLYTAKERGRNEIEPHPDFWSAYNLPLFDEQQVEVDPPPPHDPN
jgi:diguanylate cyclase (GGDEF)-like protein